MLVRLRHGLASDELDPLLALCRDLGYSARFLDEGRRVLELTDLLGDGAHGLLAIGDGHAAALGGEAVRQRRTDALRGTGHERDEVVTEMVDQVKERIRSLIRQGRALREGEISEEDLVLS